MRASKVLLLLLIPLLIFPSISAARYLTSDPIGLERGINPYVYVEDDPVNAVDPFGLTRMTFITTSGILMVDPEMADRLPYLIQATSGIDSCMNRPPCEREFNIGPIPSGRYTIDVNQLNNPNHFRDLYNTLRYGDWGDWNVPITPLPGTNTHGRGVQGKFYLHGGFLPGSAGCVDYGGGIFGNAVSDRLLKDILNDSDMVVPFDVIWVPRYNK